MKEEKQAYISILTTEDYLDGLKVMYQSLRRFTDKEVVVLVRNGITEAAVQVLSKMGMQVVRADDLVILPELLSERLKRDRWYHTLYKLRVFGMTDYDRLVYLDSDLLICGNLDELFQKKTMSAVSDLDFFQSYSRGGINAGVFSFQPSKELEQKLMDKIPEAAKKSEVFGDQDVINAYYDTWETEPEKHLEVKYNACFYQLDHYDEQEPLAVHFIMASKPWMWSNGQSMMKYIKWFLQGKKKQRKYLRQYRKILKSVR